MEVKQEEEEEGTIKTEVIEVASSASPDGTPIRPIFCLNKTNMENLRKFEETEDCFILDFDPSEIDNSLLRFSTLSVCSSSDDDGGGDLSVVAEKGQVACRDYPHSRHLCIKYPFDKTPRESYCELCFCYVCDCAAPCKDWKDSKSAHCNASEKIGDWKEQRRLKRKEEIKLPNSQAFCFLLLVFDTVHGKKDPFDVNQSNSCLEFDVLLLGACSQYVVCDCLERLLSVIFCYWFEMEMVQHGALVTDQ